MKKIILLFGGNSSEHKISCLSSKSIYENIDKKKFDVTLVGIDFDNNWFIYKDDINLLKTGDWLSAKNKMKIYNVIDFLKHFDVVFPMIHGRNGEDGRLQGMLELFEIPFVGCGLIASAIGMDKGFAKMMFSNLEIPQVPYVILNNKDINKVEKELNYPLIVKPANGGSSVGIMKANNKNELKIAIDEAFKYDNKIIVEKFIKARELECAALSDNKKLIISTVGEIIPANEFYDYDAKYINNDSKTIIPADISKDLNDQIKLYAKRAFNGLGCFGLTRIDFLYDVEFNKLYINEVNTIPGFTNISMYPKLLEYDGVKYKNLITKLINSALIK